MPGAWRRKRGCLPTRSPPPNWCCSASSICRRSTALPPQPRTNSARRSPPSRLSPRRWNGRLADDPRYQEDVTLLRSQSERCREILKRLTSLSSESEAHLCAAAADLADRGGDRARIAISASRSSSSRASTAVRSRSAGAIPASSTDLAIWSRTPSISPAKRDRALALERGSGRASTIIDDGPGFPPEIIDRIGEPYMSTRQGAEARRRPGPGAFHRQDAARTLGRDAAISAIRADGRGRRRADLVAAQCLPQSRSASAAHVRHGGLTAGSKNWTMVLRN